MSLDREEKGIVRNLSLSLAYPAFKHWIILPALLVLLAEPYLPLIFTRAVRYGKFCAKAHHPLIEKIEMPKKCLGHFYLLSGPMLIVLFYLALNKYLYNGNIPENLLSLLDILLGASRKPLGI
ncbi:uncharacterized protein LOC105422474 isoform X1 [Pogonomyrmex barbatus]|uniref:Uncharacterized protein LOC105422474 isoform X1 n=1 Tax=Pogonomyrmex barbatus TaxID=144034 RepID=A0A6I9VRC0_9HYME|nr:uncharacterized protein LOC105422474 isoform X1 [Pogonomyrmex barbatus]XP_011630145.1 uncharacterized protein LOC105422474 isoform X1 [Pogonomyrmex barbatus]XP_011630146.1 uncharacterized protein LOC105422474 isoform X1 [Pogonomyrmex barbatus]XP_011630147.1 uncharacterized protein LOC105422474 isoform X1 [Pogonomyrmex barbatus]